MDLISRQQAIDAIEKTKTVRSENNELYVAKINAEMNIMQLPSAEPQERKTGYWQITDAYPHNVYCSKCHKRFAQTHWEVWEDGSLPRKFCPNCGADMRGERNEP